MPPSRVYLMLVRGLVASPSYVSERPGNACEKSNGNHDPMLASDCLAVRQMSVSVHCLRHVISD